MYSFFVALAVPLFTFSLDPKDPSEACERFITEKEKKNCLGKVNHTQVDWYATSFCEKIDDDPTFLKCLDSLQKAQFDPRAIATCESFLDLEDSAKLRCLQAIKNRPAGVCQSKKSLADFEQCLGKNARQPANEKSFFQK